MRLQVVTCFRRSGKHLDSCLFTLSLTMTSVKILLTFVHTVTDVVTHSQAQNLFHVLYNLMLVLHRGSEMYTC